MYLYIFGIALLFGGYVTFTKSMGTLDNNVSRLVTIRKISGFLSFTFLLLGAFLHAWWTPILGILISIILWMVINTIALKIKFSLVAALRSHIGIVIGIAMCLLSFF